MIDALGRFDVSKLPDTLVTLVILLVTSVVAIQFVRILTRRLERRVDVIYADEPNRHARLKTLLRTTNNSARVLVMVVGLLVALERVGINIGPVLTAAGIVGLTISLGAQTLIKDYLGGLIIVLEDQYRVGDHIIVNGVKGTVEKITLRRTNVRDINGDLHIVSNGDVRAVNNRTRDYSRALVEIPLAFDADIDKAIDALQGAMARTMEDAHLKEELLEPPEIFGWNQFNEWGSRYGCGPRSSRERSGGWCG